ncbi:MAG: hypothetical protein RPR40_09485 [Bermanella sp.]
MKSLLALCCMLLSVPSLAEHRVFVGLYSDHYGYKQYEDYRASSRRHQEIRPLNQGGPKASKLMGYMYTAPGYSLGACTFKNSFYERTHCLLGLLRYPVTDSVIFETGLNLTYGYRPALIMQMASLSMSKKLLPIPMVGITFEYKKSSLSYNYMAPGITTLVLAWKL